MSFSETEIETEQCCLIKEEGPGDLTTFSALQKIKYVIWETGSLGTVKNRALCTEISSVMYTIRKGCGKDAPENFMSKGH